MQNLSCENEFFSMRLKNHLHINSFTYSLTLKQTLGKTQRWPIQTSPAKPNANQQLIYCSDIHFPVGHPAQNNQRQGKCHQPRRRLRLITVTGNLILDIAKLNLIIGFLYTFLKKIMTNTPSQGSKLTLSLDIMHCACNLQISQLFACR